MCLPSAVHRSAAKSMIADWSTEGGRATVPVGGWGGG